MEVKLGLFDFLIQKNHKISKKVIAKLVKHYQSFGNVDPPVLPDVTSHLGGTKISVGLFLQCFKHQTTTTPTPQLCHMQVLWSVGLSFDWSVCGS